MARTRRGDDDDAVAVAQAQPQAYTFPEAYGPHPGCKRCLDSGRLPLPVFALGRWYQRTYLCSCSVGRAYQATAGGRYADGVPGAPQGLSVSELNALWGRMSGGVGMLEAAQDLDRNPGSRHIDGRKILRAVELALEDEAHGYAPQNELPF